LDRYETSQQRAGLVTPKLVWILESIVEGNGIWVEGSTEVKCDEYCGFAVISSFVNVTEGEEECSFSGVVRFTSRLKVVKVRGANVAADGKGRVVRLV
jgi:hypothetical protein